MENDTLHLNAQQEAARQVYEDATHERLWTCVEWKTTGPIQPTHKNIIGYSRGLLVLSQANDVVLYEFDEQSQPALVGTVFHVNISAIKWASVTGTGFTFSLSGSTITIRNFYSVTRDVEDSTKDITEIGTSDEEIIEKRRDWFAAFKRANVTIKKDFHEPWLSPRAKDSLSIVLAVVLLLIMLIVIDKMR